MFWSSSDCRRGEIQSRRIESVSVTAVRGTPLSPQFTALGIECIRQGQIEVGVIEHDGRELSALGASVSTPDSTRAASRSETVRKVAEIVPQKR